MAKALRHHFAARRMGKQAAEVREYEVLDPAAKPDHKGEVVGVKARRLGGKTVVALTDKQAKYYLTVNAIRPLTN